MRIIFLYLIIGQTFAVSNNFEPINIKKTTNLKLLQDIYRPVPFISHDNPSKAYGTYLSRNIYFEPISKVRQYIELQRNLKLKHRGEAHITVITPPEYNLMKQWNPRINMKSINHLVNSLVQHMHFYILGIGSLKGLNINNQESEVFFLVIKSRGLRAIRKLIAAEWSIPKHIFDSMKQDFHITIGFTVSDLFPRLGFEAKKDISAIQSDLHVNFIK
tara:strand:+ start:2046 stop:2696 length:651 start_codon:yes stop_codon:yes gene_type:complete